MVGKVFKYCFKIVILSIVCSFLLTGGLALSESSYRKDVPSVVNTREELLKKVDENTRNLKSSFSFQLGANLWKELVKNEFEDVMFYCNMCSGIESSQSYYVSTDRLLVIENIEYYPGFKIVQKMKRNLTDVRLTAREQETYYVANDVAERVAGRSELEKERIIHDSLCDWVTYTIDESTDEDDNAIGAILNRKANCDGYTDAFYLLCSLAGLDAGYMGYNVYAEDEKNSDDNHVWNLVKVNGNWVMVDLTWDDSDGDLPTTYAYYNIGKERASETHIWKEWMVTVPWINKTEAKLRPDDFRELDVKTTQDIVKMANLCSKELLDRVAILPDKNMRGLFAETANSADDYLSAVMFSSGIKSWQSLRLSGDRYILLHKLEYYPEFTEQALTGKKILSCSSRKEMERAVRECMQSTPERFVIWYKDGYDFTKDSDALADMVYQMGCQSFSWSHNGYGRVEISDIEYYPEIAERARTGKGILSCSSRTEMENEVRKCMKSKPASFTIWYKDGYDFTKDSDALVDTIYRMGCQSFSWSVNNYGRVEVSEIKYYPEFFYCETEEEIKQYIRKCVSGKEKEFAIFMPDRLYEQYHSNNCDRWFKLLNSLSIPEQYKKSAYSNDKTRMFIIRRE